MLTAFGEIPDRFVPDMSMADMYEYVQRPVNRRSVLAAGAAAVGGLIAGPMLVAGPARAVDAPIGARRVSFGADPRTEIDVMFSSPSRFDRARVRYGTGGDFGSSVDAEVHTVTGSPTTYGLGRLRSLQPDTLYGYQVQVGSRVSETGSFRTAPAERTGFTFTAFADQGVTPAAAVAVQRIRALKPALHLLAGDLCYADVDGSGTLVDPVHQAVWDRWLSLIEPLAADVPWMVAMGNHEMEPGAGPQGYKGVFARMARPESGPREHPAAYSFEYSNVGFIALDSNDVSYEIPRDLNYTRGAQTRWLEKTLASMRGRVDFIVVFFHHCAYSTNGAHGSEGGVRDAWVGLFDRYEVDLVVNGHNHCFERTRPMRGGAPLDVTDEVDSSAGTTYVTIGGGGREINPTFLDHAHESRVTTSTGHNEIEQVDWSHARAGRHCFLTAEVRPGEAGHRSSMALSVISVSDGSVLDHVVLNRSSSAKPASGGSGDGSVLVPVVAGLGGAAALAGLGLYGRRHANADRPGW